MTAVNDSPATTTGAIGRTRASLAALETLEHLRESGQPASDADRTLLLGWAGWGSLANAFEANRSGTWAEIGERIKWLLPPAEQIEARQGTYSAFYTPPAIIRACWQILQSLAFDDGRLLEPGCGAGVFIRLQINAHAARIAALTTLVGSPNGHVVCDLANRAAGAHQPAGGTE